MIEDVCVMVQSEGRIVKGSLFNNGVQQGNFFFGMDEALPMDILSSFTFWATLYSQLAASVLESEIHV